MEGSKHQHNHGHAYKGPTETTFLGIDPSNLDNMPKDFYDSEQFLQRSSLSDPQELAHFRTVVATFFNYRNDSFRDMIFMEKNFYKIPERHKEILQSFFDRRFDRLRAAINQNYKVLCPIVDEYQNLFHWKSMESGDKYLDAFYVASKEVSRIRTTLKQIVREWTAEGREERDNTFSPCLAALEKYYPDKSKRASIEVLVPGCGLGRLPFEIFSRGFSCQGNEFSYYMLLASNYILNQDLEKEQLRIVPYIHSFNNKLSDDDNFREYSFPDLRLTEAIDPDSQAAFSMVAGEFVEVYTKKPASQDVVVTCFFIDTAHNVLQYLETIHALLKPGGLWINVGPLLYHYADSEEDSIELPWDQLKVVIANLGFKLLVGTSHNRKSPMCLRSPTATTVLLS